MQAPSAEASIDATTAASPDVAQVHWSETAPRGIPVGGPLLNTWQLESRTWFAVLLRLGIFNLGFVAMIAYLLGAPDSATAPALRRTNAPVGT